MPKRRASGDFLCPGCQSKFDPESHAPFIGSCGHSLCGVCVNEKQRFDCFVCGKEGSFVLKQRNDLASELLAANSKKKPKFTLKFEVGEDIYPSAEQVPAILDPTNRAFLAQIVNQLDPKSFINLASSCKTLYNYCFNSKEIKIVYDNLWMSTSAAIYSEDVYYFYLAKTEYQYGDVWNYKYDIYRPMNYTGKKFGFLGSKINRKKLRNYPFVFRLEKLKIRDGLGEDYVDDLRTLLGEFPIESIKSVHFENVSDWDGFLQLLKDFKVKDVENKDYCFSEDEEYPEDVAEYIFQNTNRFSTDQCFPERLILNSSVRLLSASFTNISQATFVDLLKRFSNSTEDISWNLGYDEIEFGHHNLFKVLPFNYEGPLPDERPLIFVNDDSEEFWVLRKDGKVMFCWTHSDDRWIHFSTDNHYGFRYPLLLAPPRV